MRNIPLKIIPNELPIPPVSGVGFLWNFLFTIAFGFMGGVYYNRGGELKQLLLTCWKRSQLQSLYMAQCSVLFFLMFF